MPIIKSAKKQMRQDVRRTARNQVTRNNVRQARKLFGVAKKTGDKKKIATATANLQSALGTAVKKNVIQKNRAARILSRALTGTKKQSVKTAKTPAVKKTVATKKVTPKKAVVKKATTKKPAVKKPAAKKAKKS